MSKTLIKTIYIHVKAGEDDRAREIMGKLDDIISSLCTQLPELDMEQEWDTIGGEEVTP